LVPLNKNRGTIRWLIFALGIIIAILAIVEGEVFKAIFSFLLGMIVGFLLDCLGVAKLKLWYYTKQPFLSKSYFGIVIPAWGVFSMALNFLWDKIPFSQIATFSLITVFLFSLHEIPNLKTQSWKYSVSMKVVIAGWIPLVYGIRVIFLLLSSIF